MLSNAPYIYEIYNILLLAVHVINVNVIIVLIPDNHFHASVSNRFITLFYQITHAYLISMQFLRNVVIFLVSYGTPGLLNFEFIFAGNCLVTSRDRHGSWLRNILLAQSWQTFTWLEREFFLVVIEMFKYSDPLILHTTVDVTESA
jgi:hypothetical protein